MTHWYMNFSEGQQADWQGAAQKTECVRENIPLLELDQWLIKKT